MKKICPDYWEVNEEKFSLWAFWVDTFSSHYINVAEITKAKLPQSASGNISTLSLSLSLSSLSLSLCVSVSSKSIFCKTLRRLDSSIKVFKVSFIFVEVFAAVIWINLKRITKKVNSYVFSQFSKSICKIAGYISSIKVCIDSFLLVEGFLVTTFSNLLLAWDI